MRASDRIAIGAGIVTLVATALLYAGHLDAPFFFDDFFSVVRNDRIEQLWPPTWAWYEQENPLAARPASSLSLALDHARHGDAPRGYRVTSLALHLANALLVLVVVRRLLTAWPAVAASARQAALLAGGTTLLWAIHPLVTEPVMYVTQRTELLVSLAWLAAFAASQRRFAAGSRGAAGAWSGLAALAALLGALSKEVIVTLPLVVALYDRAFVSSGFGRALRRHVDLYAGLALSWIVLAALVWTGPRVQAVATQIPPLAYLRTQAGVVAEYLRLAMWPDALRLSHPPRIAWSWGDIPFPGLLLIGLGCVTLWACWRRPRVGFAGAWFFLLLAPSSSLVPVVTEIAAERRVYLALVAVVAAAICAGWWLLRRLGPGRVAVATALGSLLYVSVAAALVARSEDRLGDYRSRAALWREEVRVDPAHPGAALNLAMALWDAGSREQAADALVASLDKFAALDTRTRALLLQATALDGAVAVARATGREEALLTRLRALTQAHPDLPHLQVSYGRLCLESRRWDEAVAAFERATQLDSRASAPWLGLADAFERSGNEEAARAALDEAIARTQGAERARLVVRRRSFEAPTR